MIYSAPANRGCLSSMSPTIVRKPLSASESSPVLLRMLPGATVPEATASFVQLRGALYHFVFPIVRDQGEAEDITQEVFLRLFCAISDGEAILAVRAWLFRVARNLAIDRHRRAAHLKYLDEEDWNGTPEPAPNAEERLLRHQHRQLLSAAVRRLSPRERYCLEMRAAG